MLPLKSFSKEFKSSKDFEKKSILGFRTKISLSFKNMQLISTKLHSLFWFFKICFFHIGLNLCSQTNKNVLGLGESFYLKLTDSFGKKFVSIILECSKICMILLFEVDSKMLFQSKNFSQSWVGISSFNMFCFGLILYIREHFIKLNYFLTF